MRISTRSAMVFSLSFLAICFIPTAAAADEGSAAAETGAAHWAIDPEHETIKPRVSYVPGLKVVRGTTQVIVPEHKSFCPAGSVFRFNNGDIQVHNKHSTDGGKTWIDAGHILESSTYQFPAPDNEVIMFQSSFTSEHATGEGRPEVSMVKTDEDGVFEVKFFRSTDHGKTRVGDPARVYLPVPYRDWSGVLCRKIVGLGDGTLLMSMYTRNADGPAHERKFRSLALKSTDRGKTWHYLSTIAADLSADARGEGFDESTLLVLPDGRVQAYMRSGASYQASMGSHNYGDKTVDMPFGYAKQTPVYLATSLDGGESWGVPDPITPYGVWPNALRMESGILALSYGRPGNWIMFSQDDGTSWGPIIPFFHDLYPPDCSNYFAMAEVAPDVLLVVYARVNPNDHWRSEFAGTYFHVVREDRR
jgi:hypothetical protein